MNAEANETRSWYAIYVDNKREHLISQMLRARFDLEVLCPRIAFYRKLRRGKVRFIEALFPCYIFILCDIESQFRQIKSVNGVKKVVKTGNTFPKIPEAAISEIRDHLEKEIIDTTQDEMFRPGDEVQIVEGPFLNLKAVIQAYDNGTQRVSILLEFMERTIKLDMHRGNLMKNDGNPRERIGIQ